MGPGGIATIIAASALVIIALALSYTIIRVSRLIDEVQKTVNNVNRIAATAESLTGKVSGAINGLLEKESSAMKILGMIASFAGRRNSTKDQD
jgi:uncharacterized protein YoxC